jgi:hypothetical protein
MLKIPNIVAYLKEYKHSKKQSAETLLSQLGEFHLQAVPYNSPYSSQINTPLSWWKMCPPIPPYLQLLAIKLFSIAPHAASCERVWSICGWTIGKRRTRLSVDNLEAMLKIHSYYITNSKSELTNYGKDRTAEEIRATLNDVQRHIEEDEVEGYNEEEMTEIVARSYTDDNLEQISPQELEISNILDLDLMFGNDSVINKQLDIDELDSFIQDLNKEDDFDPDLLVQNFASN